MSADLKLAEISLAEMASTLQVARGRHASETVDLEAKRLQQVRSLENQLVAERKGAKEQITAARKHASDLEVQREVVVGEQAAAVTVLTHELDSVELWYVQCQGQADDR